MNLRLFLLGFILAALLGSWAGSCVLYRAAQLGEQVAPIDPRQFAPLELVAVGTGNAYENPVRRGPSIGVGLGDRVALVDAGAGTSEGLRLSAIPVSQPDTVFLTNLLPENTAGLDELLYIGWLRGRTSALRIVGPSGTRVLVDGIEAAHAEGGAALGRSLGLPAAGARIEVIEVGDGWSETRGGVTVRAGALPGGPLPALAWRFESEALTAVVSGTGWAPDALVEFTQGADLLVHEAVLIPVGAEAEEAGVTDDLRRLEREAALHTSLLDVGPLASRAGVHTLVLIRLRPPPFFELQIKGPIRQTFDGAIQIPDDGDSIAP